MQEVPVSLVACLSATIRVNNVADVVSSHQTSLKLTTDSCTQNRMTSIDR